MQAISPYLADFLTPLSEATAKLLAADRFLLESDLLEISIQEIGNNRRFVFNHKSTSRFPHASTHAQTRWFYRIPGASVNAQDVATAPITDITVLVTLACWGKHRITFKDILARMEFWTRFGEYMKNQKVTQIQAEFKEFKRIPERAPTGPVNRLFMPHQRVASLCMLESDTYNLFMEMRTGKSGAVIGAMDADCLVAPGAMNLIVCPKNVRSNWVNEIKSFTTRNVHIVVVRGDKIDRIKTLLTAFEYRNNYDYTVVLISYEGLVGTLSQVCAFQWRRGVLDESHYFKSSATHRWRAVKMLRDRCEKRNALTGTPICNTAFDLYTQFEWLNEGGSGFASRDEFRKFYGTWEPTGQGFERLVGMRNLPLLQERLTRTSFLISKKEALPDLPPVTHTVLECEPTRAQIEIYDQVSNVLYAEIEQELGDPKTITVSNILTKLLRLAQITAGFVSVDGEVDINTGEIITREIDRFDPNPKLDLLIESIKELDPSSKAIVWACFTQSIRTIAARLELEGIKHVTFYGQTKDNDRDAAIYAFNNDPDTKIFVGNPAAGGVGINLPGRGTEGRALLTQCDTIYYYAQGWSSPVRIQSASRPQSKACTWPIEIIDLCMIDTIDFDILDRVLDKALHAMQIQDVRNLLNRILKR